jgi:multidrug efflux pump subunit AcrB
VQVLGAGPYSMRIWLDPTKLQAFGLTALEVQNAVQNQNLQIASGQLGGPPVPSDQVFENFTPDSAPCGAIRHSLDLEVQTPNSSPSPSSEDTSKTSDALPRDSDSKR